MVESSIFILFSATRGIYICWSLRYNLPLNLKSIKSLQKDLQTMPIIKSAKKRVRRAETQAIANAKTKRSMREKIKAFYADIASKKDTTKSQAAAYSALDTAVKKNVISKHRAARKKSQLNTASKAAGTTKAGTKAKKTSAAPKKTTPAKKTTAKKTPAKKAPAKKTAKK